MYSTQGTATLKHRAKFSYYVSGTVSTERGLWVCFLFFGGEQGWRACGFFFVRFLKTSHRSQARWLNAATTNAATTPSGLFIEWNS